MNPFTAHYEFVNTTPVNVRLQSNNDEEYGYINLQFTTNNT